MGVNSRSVLIPTRDLVTIAQDVADGIASGDSLEGYLGWLLPLPPVPGQPDPPRDHHLVEARYRIGNMTGQGGMRILGAADQLALDPSLRCPFMQGDDPCPHQASLLAEPVRVQLGAGRSFQTLLVWTCQVHRGWLQRDAPLLGGQVWDVKR